MNRESYILTKEEADLNRFLLNKSHTVYVKNRRPADYVILNQQTGQKWKEVNRKMRGMYLSQRGFFRKIVDYVFSIEQSFAYLNNLGGTPVICLNQINTTQPDVTFVYEGSNLKFEMTSGKLGEFSLTNEPVVATVRKFTVPVGDISLDEVARFKKELQTKVVVFDPISGEVNHPSTLLPMEKDYFFPSPTNDQPTDGECLPGVSNLDLELIPEIRLVLLKEPSERELITFNLKGIV